MKRRSKGAALAWAAACLVLSACSGGSNGGKSANAPAGQSPLEGKVDVLALVLASDGEPVENALMGGGDAVSTGDGIIAGTVTPPDSGWVSVGADGYATGYMKRSGKPLKGWYIFETHLTPISSAAIFDPGAGARLVASDGTASTVTVEVGPGAFSKPDVIVETALMRPADVGPEFAPLNGASGLYLKEALFVSAQDAPGKSVSLAAGQTLRATIRDRGLGRHFALARFDAQGGQWNVLKGACQRSDDNRIRCVLPGDGTYGFFTASAPAGGAGNPYRDARHAFDRAMEDWRRARGGRAVRQGMKIPSPVRDAGLALIKAAREYAVDHHDERGQMHLISTAAEVQLLGMPVVGRDLIDDARKYVKGAAQTLLGQETDCARVRTLLDTAAKADLLGMDQTRHDLIFKARNSYKSCDVWAGTVRYTFFLDRQWAGKEGFERTGGPGIWDEEHRIKLLVSPMSRKTKGTDQVTVSLPAVSYRRGLKDKCGGRSYEERSVSGVPEHATMELIVDGLYDYVHDRFQLSAFKPLARDELPRIELHRRSRIWKGSGDACRETRSDSSMVLVKHYASMLTGAFGGESTGPSVQEMLNQGQRRRLGNGRVVQGGRLIDLKAPKGGLPVTRARVTWHLINVPPTP